MPILRSVAAVAAGFGFAVLSASMPATYAAVHVAITVFGAVLGGWMTARIASFAPLGHATVLAILLAALTISSAVNAPAAERPGGFAIGVAILGILGVLVGGWVRASAGAPPADPHSPARP